MKPFWITALKGFDEGEIELNIALNGITDLNSASTFFITGHKPELRQPADLYFPLPVLSLEGVFITKLIAQREKDIADLLSILLLKANHLNSQRFWYEAEESGLIHKLPARLRELVKRIRDGEAMSIWYQHTELILSEAETKSTLTQLHRLLRGYRKTHGNDGPHPALTP